VTWLHVLPCTVPAASEYIYNKYKDVKTCDVIEENELDGIKKVAEPIGVIAGEGRQLFAIWRVAVLLMSSGC
jgi:hypothetical protein